MPAVTDPLDDRVPPSIFPLAVIFPANTPMFPAVTLTPAVELTPAEETVPTAVKLAPAFILPEEALMSPVVAKILPPDEEMSPVVVKEEPLKILALTVPAKALISPAVATIFPVELVMSLVALIDDPDIAPDEADILPKEATISPELEVILFVTLRESPSIEVADNEPTVAFPLLRVPEPTLREAPEIAPVEFKLPTLATPVVVIVPEVIA